MIGVAVACGVGASAGGELLGRVLADHLEESVPRARVHLVALDQRLGHELAEEVESVRVGGLDVGRERDGGFEVEAAEAHREPLQQHLRVRREQFVRPVDGCTQRLVPFHRPTPPTGRSSELSIEATLDLHRGHDAV